MAKTNLKKKSKELVNKAKTTAKTAAKNPNVILGTILIAGGGFILYKVYKTLFPPEKTLEDLSQDNSLPPSGLSDVAAKVIADELYAAMIVISGTDEEAIFDALSGLTINDFIKVYQAFGLRQYSIFWGNQGDPLFSDDHDLIAWLTNELTPGELRQLEQTISGLDFGSFQN